MHARDIHACTAMSNWRERMLSSKAPDRLLMPYDVVQAPAYSFTIELTNQIDLTTSLQYRKHPRMRGSARQMYTRLS